MFRYERTTAQFKEPRTLANQADLRLRHVEQQGSVPVRQRSHNVVPLQRTDSRDAVGPGREEVPGAVEFAERRRAETPRIETEVLQHAVQVLAVQHVQRDKRPLSGT